MKVDSLLVQVASLLPHLVYHMSLLTQSIGSTQFPPERLIT